MTRTAIDFSAAFPSAAAVRAAGHEAVIGYFSDSRPGANFGAKPMTKTAADAYRTGGVDLVTNYQYGKGATSDWRGGYDAGVNHAKQCLAHHFAAGGPPFRPLYAPVDDNPTLDEYNRLIAPFLRGWESVVGHDWTGVYGNSLVHAWAQEDGLGSWWWLHNWGGDRTPDAQTHLHQVQIDKGTVDGIGVDINEILRDDYGQWSKAVAPAPGPAPQPAPGVPMPPRRAMWSPNCDGRARNVTWLCFHTQEGDGSADSLARYLDNPNSQVSYNSVGDAREIVDVVPFDQSPWAAMGANGRADHFCFAGSRAAWSRQQWLDCGMLDNAAAWLADRAQARGIPFAYVGPDGVRTGTPGVIGHWDWTRGAGEGSHTDPGPNFPWDELTARAQRFAQPQAQPAQEDDMTPEQDTIMRDIREQLTGSRDPGMYPGFPQLGGKTLVDALADCQRELTLVLPNRVNGQTGDTLLGYADNADKYGFENASRLDALRDKLAAIAAKVGA